MNTAVWTIFFTETILFTVSLVFAYRLDYYAIFLRLRVVVAACHIHISIYLHSNAMYIVHQFAMYDVYVHIQV